MPRPRTEPGTHGEITVHDKGEYVIARVWYRTWAGERKQLERRRDSRVQAENAVKAAVRDALREGSGEDATASTTLTALCKTFLERKRDEGRSQATLSSYESVAKVITGPAGIGELTLREATPGRVGKFLRNVAKKRGHGVAKTARSVLSGMFGIAIEEGALAVNPLRQLNKLKRPKPDGAKPIPLEQVSTLREQIIASTYLVMRDLGDMLLLMLYTGMRIGEVCALWWSDIDFDAGTISVQATAVRKPGEGMVRQDRPKTDASKRTISVPSAALKLLKQRDKVDEFVFPTASGRPRDPSYIERQLRACRDDLGQPEMTTHSFRKTVATALDAAGFSARAIADYLGHARPSMTEDVYMARKQDTSAVAKAMNDGIVLGEFVGNHAPKPAPGQDDESPTPQEIYGE